LRVLASVFAAAALVLLMPTSGRLPDSSPTRPVDRLRPRAGVGLAALALGTAMGLVAVVDGVHLVLAMIVLACIACAAELVRRSRRARAAERRQRLVVEVCEAMVGELRAGQPLLRSLEHCVEVWPDMDTVLGAGRLGADVPAALRRLARRPGAEGLRHVAAAWQVSQSSGAGLATVLSQVAHTARERESTRHLVRGELASAQATARLVAVLPLGSLAMSAGIGGDPWHFLLDTAVGLACLGAGCACAFAGLVWIDRIAANVLRG
jgi:tight adherence protein B